MAGRDPHSSVRNNSASVKNTAMADTRRRQSARRTIGLVLSVLTPSRRFAQPSADRLSFNQITTAASMTRDFVLMKSSTKDKIKGGLREAKGNVKEKAGKTTGNPDLRDRGTIEKTGGKVQRKVGDIKKVFEQ